MSSMVLTNAWMCFRMQKFADSGKLQARWVHYLQWFPCQAEPYYNYISGFLHFPDDTCIPQLACSDNALHYCVEHVHHDSVEHIQYMVTSCWCAHCLHSLFLGISTSAYHYDHICSHFIVMFVMFLLTLALLHIACLISIPHSTTHKTLLCLKHATGEESPASNLVVYCHSVNVSGCPIYFLQAHCLASAVCFDAISGVKYIRRVTGVIWHVNVKGNECVVQIVCDARLHSIL